MKAREFTAMTIDGMFQLIDATKAGYMTRPTEIICADRNVIDMRYGDMEVCKVEALRKDKFRLYVK